MPRSRAGGGRGGQGGSGTFDGRRTHVLRVWAGAGGWVGLGLWPLLVVEAHGHSTRPRCTRLDLTGPDPPDCGQSPDLPQRERVCVGRAWAGGCGGWHSRLSGHTAPPPQAQFCSGGGGGAVGTPVRSTVWVLLGVVCCGPRQWGSGTTTLRAPGDLGSARSAGATSGGGARRVESPGTHPLGGSSCEECNGDGGGNVDHSTEQWVCGLVSADVSS